MERKKIFMAVICGVALFGITITANAGETYFSKKYVDSNSYTAICSANKQTSGSQGEIKITGIYEADGSDSNYRRIYCKAGSDGTEKLVYKGDWYSLTLPSRYQMPGCTITLYAKGHNPSLDCQISGYWNVH